MSVWAHELEITVVGDDAAHIESQAIAAGEAYFGGPVRVSIDVTQYITGWDQTPTNFKARVIIGRERPRKPPTPPRRLTR